MSAFGQKASNESGFITHVWTARDGLPDETVQAFAQTADGLLWIGTPAGLFRFDGKSFGTTDLGKALSAVERGVNCLLVDRENSLWIGTAGGGVVRYRKGVAEFLVVPGQQPSEFVRSFFQDSQGAMWIGSDQGLYRVNGEYLERIDATKGVPRIFVRTITGNKDGDLWVGGSTLLRLHAGALVKEYPLNLANGRNLRVVVNALNTDESENIWVGTPSGLSRLDDDQFVAVPNFPAEVLSLTRGDRNSLWVGTVGKGISVHQGNSFQRVALSDITGRTTLTIFQDKEGDTWVGTRTGIVQLIPTPMHLVEFQHGVDAESQSIYQDRDGALLVPTSDRIWRILGDSSTPYSSRTLDHVRVSTLMRDRDGVLWAGTQGAGLIRTGPHSQSFHAPHGGLINNYVRALLEAKDGSLWVGTNGGVTQITRSGSNDFDMPNGLAYFSVASLFQDRVGDIWVGTSRGLSHLREIGGRAVYLHDPAVQQMSPWKIWSVVQDSDGVLWFGTNNGLYSVDGASQSESSSVTHLTTAQGLATNSIFQLVLGPGGKIWFSGPNSISRVSLSQLDQVAHGKADRVQLDFFLGPRDLQSSSLYSGTQAQGVAGVHGDAWFASNKGVIHLSPMQGLPHVVFPLKIDRVVADGLEIPSNRPVVLRPGSNQLQISFQSVNLRSFQNVRYQYSMVGLDSWSAPSVNSDAYYSHLPSGHYTFRARAYAIDHPDALSEISLDVVQKPHLYATWWFDTLCVLLLVVVVWEIHEMRLRQVSIRYQATIAERERLAREMHDTVIQGGVGVAMLIEAALGVEGPDEPLRHQLMTFATEQMRKTIEQARNAVWALRHSGDVQKDVGELAIDLAKEFRANFGMRAECTISGVPFELDDVQKYEVLMTMREALTNAVKHGDPTQLRLTVSWHADSLSVSVFDDGRGFEPEVEPHEGHYGLHGMRERVSLLDGTFLVISALGGPSEISFTIPRKSGARKHLQQSMVEGGSND